MTDPSMAVAWNTDVSAPAADPQRWTPQRSSMPLSSFLRLASGGLAVLAAVLLGTSTLPALMTVEFEYGFYEVTGWPDDESSSFFGSNVSLGIPLIAAAAFFLVAAALVMWSEWQPPLRRAAGVGVMAAAAFAAAQLWVIGSYLSDFLLEIQANADDSTQALRGGGYWLLLAGTLVGLLAVIVLALAPVRFQKRGDAARVATAPALETTWGGSR